MKTDRHVMNRFVKVEELQGRLSIKKKLIVSNIVPEETWNIDVDQEKGEMNCKKT